MGEGREEGYRKAWNDSTENGQFVASGLTGFGRTMTTLHATLDLGVHRDVRVSGQF